MHIGYARVSTMDQNLDLQEDALKKAGCEMVFKDISSGSKQVRIGLQEALNYAREKDVVVVWKLDRLGRSLKHLIEVINYLNAKKVGFQSLQEKIDTTTSGGKLVFHLFGALAEFERELIQERTQAGLQAARARGRKGGRPPVMTKKKKTILEQLANDSSNSVSEICRTLQISRATFYRYQSRNRT